MKEIQVDHKTVIQSPWHNTLSHFLRVSWANQKRKTNDKYHDIVICAISSIAPGKISNREILVRKNDPSFAQTGLRVDSVIKIDRIATLRQANVIAKIGKCSSELWGKVAEKFCNLTR